MKKKVSKNGLKKGAVSNANQLLFAPIFPYLPLFADQEAPGEAASRAHFSNKKQLFEQQQQKKQKKAETSRRKAGKNTLLKQETVVRATIAEKNRTKQKKTETSRRKAKQNINKQKHQQQIRKKQKENRQHTENNCSNC